MDNSVLFGLTGILCAGILMEASVKVLSLPLLKHLPLPVSYALFLATVFGGTHLLGFM